MDHTRHIAALHPPDDSPTEFALPVPKEPYALMIGNWHSLPSSVSRKNLSIERNTKLLNSSVLNGTFSFSQNETRNGPLSVGPTGIQV